MVGVFSLLWVAVSPQAHDSATTARFRQALAAVDDSLLAIRGVAAGVRADLDAASAALVLSRAERQRTRCHGARAAVTNLLSVLSSGVYTPRGAGAQQALRQEAAALARSLERCEREWTPSAPANTADSLRAWGPHRLVQLEQALRRYQIQVVSFRRSANLK